MTALSNLPGYCRGWKALLKIKQLAMKTAKHRSIHFLSANVCDVQLRALFKFGESGANTEAGWKVRQRNLTVKNFELFGPKPYK